MLRLPMVMPQLYLPHKLYPLLSQLLCEAYQLALSEFYKERQRSENKEYHARKLLLMKLQKELKQEREALEKLRTEEDSLDLEPLLALPWSARFMELEREELMRGIEFMESQAEVQ